MRRAAEPNRRRTPATTTPPANPSPAPSGGPLPLPPPGKPVRPIGPAGLKALREAIRSGRYPSDAVVRDGVERLIRRDR